jgi:4-amino-4-deoxy-L-arabinose transferase-like glycosyltransferase
MFLALFITVAIYLLQLFIEKPSKKTQLLFWGICGLGFMVKGPHALMFPLIGYLFLAIVLWKSTKLPIKQLFWWPGPLLMILIIAPWYYYILNTIPNALEVIKGETIDRFTSVAAHTRPFWYYLRSTTLFPWIILAIPATNYFWQKRNKFGIFSASTIFGNILILSLIQSKKNVYLLPLIPVVSTMVAIWLTAIWNKHTTKWIHIIKPILFLGVIVTLATPLILLTYYYHNISIYGFISIIITIGVTLNLLLKKSSWINSSYTSFLIIPLFIILIANNWYQIGSPIDNTRKSYKMFGQKIRTILKDTNIFIYNHENYSLSFYLQKSPTPIVSGDILQKGSYIIIGKEALNNLKLPAFDKIITTEHLIKNIIQPKIHKLVLIKLKEGGQITKKNLLTKFRNKPIINDRSKELYEI